MSRSPLCVAALMAAGVCSCTTSPAPLPDGDALRTLGDSVRASEAILAVPAPPAHSPRPPQRSAMDWHPPTRVSLGLGAGVQDFGFSTAFVNQNNNLAFTENDGDTEAFRGRLEAEHFWESQLGVSFTFELGLADEIHDDLANVTDSDLQTLDFFLGPSFRATEGTRFRMPIRVGLFLHESEFSRTVSNTPAETTRMSWGLRLAAEPEFAVMQTEDSEITVFVQASAGAGQSEVESGANKGDGYAFNLGADLGVRFKFGSFYFGPSFLYRQFYYGQTDVNDPFVFFPSDDTFTGGMLTAGFVF